MTRISRKWLRLAAGVAMAVFVAVTTGGGFPH